MFKTAEALIAEAFVMHCLRKVSISVMATCVFSITTAFSEEVPLLQAMTGDWDVKQQTWLGPDKPPVRLPAAVAHRQIINSTYLLEVMQPATDDASGSLSFRRDSAINFNPVTKRYEYLSLDTRAPQLMIEESVPSGPHLSEANLNLHGGVFLAPEWGNLKNVHFRYRLSVGAVSLDRQFVRLYLTPQDVLPRKEFLAFEYDYTRRP